MNHNGAVYLLSLALAGGVIICMLKMMEAVVVYTREGPVQVSKS